jgi:hypothetical protein
LRRLYGIEKLPAGHEHHACAGKEQQVTAGTRIDVEVGPAALHRAKRNGIDHQPRFEARLDDEESAEFLEHRHSLTGERPNGAFAPEIF